MATDLFKLPFQEAVDYFRSKGVAPTASWKDFDAVQHDMAYTVAGLLDGQLLNDMKWMTDRAISEGLDVEDLKAIFKRNIRRKGWDPERLKGIDGEDGSDWMFRVMTETPIRRAHSASRNQQMADKEVQKLLPYRYWIHGDSREPREIHKALDYRNSGKVFLADDPFWDVAAPMCAYGCKCRSALMSQSMLERLGLEVGKPPDPYDVAEEGFQRAAGMSTEKERKSAFKQSAQRLDQDIQGVVVADMKKRGLA